MHYKAKHRYFKHLAHVLRNFKNIPKTLAYRHQHYMCYQMLDPAGYIAKSVSYMAGKYTCQWYKKEVIAKSLGIGKRNGRFYSNCTNKGNLEHV